MQSQLLLINDVSVYFEWSFLELVMVQNTSWMNESEPCSKASEGESLKEGLGACFPEYCEV